jgi:hypothetical protein
VNVKKDICLCGHGREAHAMRFGLCTDCKGVRKGREISDFTCRPGACDRFTWDPKADETRGRSR